MVSVKSRSPQSDDRVHLVAGSDRDVLRCLHVHCSFDVQSVDKSLEPLIEFFALVTNTASRVESPMITYFVLRTRRG